MPHRYVKLTQFTHFLNDIQRVLWRREWLPTPVFLLGEFHGQRSLVGYSPSGCKELGMTEWLSTQLLVIHCCLTSHLKCSDTKQQPCSSAHRFWESGVRGSTENIARWSWADHLLLLQERYHIFLTSNERWRWKGSACCFLEIYSLYFKAILV